MGLTCKSSRRDLWAVVILDNGGSALVRRRIQTPSVATVSGVVQGPGGSSSELPGPPAVTSFRLARRRALRGFVPTFVFGYAVSIKGGIEYELKGS
jgi:hypothetical protein